MNLTDNNMIGFEYYGLFLTQESRNKLIDWLRASEYDYDILCESSDKVYVDHCTLLHKSHNNDKIANNIEYFMEYFIITETTPTLIINGIGQSNKALAFRVKINADICANKIPHITICTFNGGKPVDSNYITEWRDIEPIIVKCKLEKR